VSKPNGKGINGEGSTEGIWYYVYLKPDWDLMIERSADAQHVNYWKEKVVPLLLDWYKLDESFRIKLSGLSAAFPRGRVLADDGRHGIYHGDDFPRGLRLEGEIKRIISGFGLSRYQILKKVDVRFEPHEQMERSQKTKLQKIIGKVPY